MNLLKQSVSKSVQTNFRMSYDFSIKIKALAGVSIPTPPDFNIFLIENSYGQTEIETNPIKVGGRVITLPVGSQPVGISFTLRDDKNETLAKWLDMMAGRCVNPDGTVNTPYDPERGFMFIIERYRLIYSGAEEPREELANSYEVFFTQRGDVTETRSEQGFLTYPATFTQLIS